MFRRDAVWYRNGLYAMLPQDTGRVRILGTESDIPNPEVAREARIEIKTSGPLAVVQGIWKLLVEHQQCTRPTHAADLASYALPSALAIVVRAM
jgi:hypothetical protein